MNDMPLTASRESVSQVQGVATSPMPPTSTPSMTIAHVQHPRYPLPPSALYASSALPYHSTTMYPPMHPTHMHAHNGLNLIKGEEARQFRRARPISILPSDTFIRRPRSLGGGGQLQKLPAAMAACAPGLLYKLLRRAGSSSLDAGPGLSLPAVVSLPAVTSPYRA